MLPSKQNAAATQKLYARGFCNSIPPHLRVELSHDFRDAGWP
jgi:hypothetical protein